MPRPLPTKSTDCTPKCALSDLMHCFWLVGCHVTSNKLHKQAVADQLKGEQDQNELDGNISHCQKVSSFSLQRLKPRGKGQRLTS